MTVLLLLPLFSLAAATANDFNCGSHLHYDTYPVSPDACLPYYLECIMGVDTKRDCATPLVYNPQTGVCDWPYNVPACTTAGISGCTDANGNSIDGLAYTRTSDCAEGYYYKCENGIANPGKCPDGLTFDVNMQMCQNPSTFPHCELQSVDRPNNGASNGFVPETTTPITSETEAAETTAGVVGPSITTDESLSSKTTEAQTNAALPETTPNPAPTTTPTTITTTTTKPTTTASPVVGDTYVGFVVDDTGSMSVEITAVKQWIEDCVSGALSSCGDEPTGGWLTVSFNDPYTGDVVGPTLDSKLITDEIESYFAHNGGDCPEMAITGIEKLAMKVPKDNAECKIFLFTDATPKDSNKENDVTALLKSKGCKFEPILTGCCGPCPPACESTNPEYCIDHVTDTATTSSTSTSSSSVATIFYSLAEETGGNIYITDKPATPEEMLDFLDEEVTLGFCPSTDIAGPSPDGYRCEADCQIMGMCWDKSVSTCYCNVTCEFSPIPNGYSHCDGAQHVDCDPNVAYEVIPDMNDCTGYFVCIDGTLHHFTCADGTVHSQTSPSHCDHPENVPPPCGTETNVVTP